ncbi:ExbD/TolR family protein [Halochromatium salexigens]|uniref:Biopolymer transporter ExbD n=1 Tax=Halochromatium salexigens TaxID=49447 RepID=A0AAJ0UHU1_HALSE|nr:biopolymer transporter ExbD [Halochromatium salexigens]MBK5930787.1 hypothetical protein [Halochromatium salexigens]
MHLAPPQQARRAAIGLTPLIDVVFILLLFFMLASSLTRLQAVSLQAPAVADAQQDAPPALLLRIRADHSLDLNGDPITDASLVETLTSQLARHPEIGVIVQPAANVDVQQLMRVFDQLAEAGVPILRLQ